MDEALPAVPSGAMKKEPYRNPRTGFALWWWRNRDDCLQLVGGVILLPLIALAMFAGLWHLLLIAAGVLFLAMILILAAGAK